MDYEELKNTIVEYIVHIGREGLKEDCYDLECDGPGDIARKSLEELMENLDFEELSIVDEAMKKLEETAEWKEAVKKLEEELDEMGKEEEE